MGAPYSEDMADLPAVHDWALRERPRALESFVDAALSLPLCAAGSGGSLAAAALAATLHRHSARPAWHTTPQLMAWEPAPDRCATLLVSGGGRNREILDALLASVRRAGGVRLDGTPIDLGRSPNRPLGVVCASEDSPLVRAVPPGAHVLARRPPFNPDGFLATRTLLATCVWIAMAYGERSPDMISYDVKWDDVIEPGFEEPRLGRCLHRWAGELSGRDHVLVLADSWGWPAAVDAESRLHESALASAQVTDWRNFAHGRHYWLARRWKSTAVLALVSPYSKELADRTLELLPTGTPVARLETNHLQAAASLNLLVKVMYLVGMLGKLNGVDPGRPVVPKFGRRIHHLNDDR